MAVSQKTRYALRALFELARRDGGPPAKVNEIAAAQDIPARFLEAILNDLKQGGFTDSRRGKDGGYVLVRDPGTITVGEVIRYVQGPLHPADDQRGGGGPPQPGTPDAPFAPIWARAEQVLAELYDGITIGELVRRDAEALRNAIDYTI